MIISEVPAKEAIEFVSKYHYAGSGTSGVARYGWLTDDDELVGVSIFDTGNHAMRQGPFGQDNWSHVFHHQRLAVHPSIPHGSTSKFLAGTLRALKRDRPDTWAVVTYADTDQGHVGTIYQATNALYTGVATKGNLYFRTPEGTIATMQSLKRFGVWSERREEAKRRGYIECRSGGKHRYIYLLGDGRERRKLQKELLWPVLPYPKKTEEVEEAA